MFNKYCSPGFESMKLQERWKKDGLLMDLIHITIVVIKCCCTFRPIWVFDNWFWEISLGIPTSHTCRSVNKTKVKVKLRSPYIASLARNRVIIRLKANLRRTKTDTNCVQHKENFVNVKICPRQSHLRFRLIEVVNCFLFVVNNNKVVL